jgi:hypothetical protein
MNKLYRTVFIVFLLIASPCIIIQAEESTNLPAEAMQPAITIKEGVMATTIENRLPQGVGKQFPATVGMLYCFNTVGGAEADTSISHTWYYQDKMMAKVVLPVRSILWRTWSSKIIMPAWKGNWKVAVTAEDGILLKTIPFTIE